MACVELSQFDSDAFGHPFYRVRCFNPDGLREEIAQLPSGPKIAVDAKVPASDVPNCHLLMSLGFRTVATMIRLTHSLSAPVAAPAGAVIVPCLDLPEAVIWQHARNFRCDRFSLDPLLDAQGGARLFFRWVANSLTQGRKQVVHIGSNFCTFAMQPDGSAVIDLVSVLEKGAGIGKALVAATINEAHRLGANALHVTTECPNHPAWNLYQRSGFQASAFTCAMHLVRGGNLN
jgi:GNAT superfamily N-acetyltransferase